MTARRRIGLAVLLLPAGLGGASPASQYLDRYKEFVGITPVAGQVGQVSNLVLRRDAAEITLEQGTVYLLSPVDGRTVGAVFQGRGRFAFRPPLPIERGALERFSGAPVLDDTITEAILLFTDSTAEQLRSVRFTAGEVPGSVRDGVRELIGSLKGEHDGSFSASIMAPLLNGETSGFFLAHLARTRGDPVLLQIDPALNEAVQLHRRVRKMRWGTNWAPVVQFPAPRPAAGISDEWRYHHRLTIPHYRLDVRLTPGGGADLDFSAMAEFSSIAAEPVGPWLRFGLHPKLVVDSARWRDGTPATVFKAKDDNDLWVKAGRRLERGDSVTLTMFYHGNLIDRYGDWFYIDPGADWWPTNQQGRDWATFDITYRSPSWYPLASVGTRTDSGVTGKVITTRWETTRPSPFATFNLGLFEAYRIQHEGAPAIEVLISEEAHRTLRRDFEARGFYLPRQRNGPENVAADISNSLKLFTHLFGDPPDQKYYVTEIPYFVGVSFPGVIHLSWGTFQNTALDGFDEYFRAHEAAHQWWGNAVRPASYRDAWLSEGLATFSGLWYLQSVRKRNDEYFKFLDLYAVNVRDTRNDAGPIWMGYRNATPGTPAYHIMTYEKGAWVFHMLRTLMFDLQTRKDDRFTAMMRDFYESYRGRTASTAEFQELVEQHAGGPMGWFFDQWVRGMDLPTYRVAWKNEPAEGGRYRVRLRVVQENVPSAFRAPVLVSADVGNNRFANFRVDVSGGQTEYLSPLLPGEAKRITFNELHSVLGEVKMERW